MSAVFWVAELSALRVLTRGKSISPDVTAGKPRAEEQWKEHPHVLVGRHNPPLAKTLHPPGLSHDNFDAVLPILVRFIRTLNALWGPSEHLPLNALRSANEQGDEGSTAHYGNYGDIGRETDSSRRVCRVVERQDAVKNGSAVGARSSDIASRTLLRQLRGQRFVIRPIFQGESPGDRVLGCSLAHQLWLCTRRGKPLTSPPPSVLLWRI